MVVGGTSKLGKTWKNIFFVHVLSDIATAMHCIPLPPVVRQIDRQTDRQKDRQGGQER